MAAVNFDKEMLIKHRFWILLGVCVLSILIAMIVLPTTVGNTIEKAQSEFKNNEKALQGITSPKNQAFVDAAQKKDNIVAGRKNMVWEEAWKTQSDLMTFPERLQDEFINVKKYLYFGDPITFDDRLKFASQYDTQLYDVVKVVQPLTPQGEGVVQAPGGNWNALLQLEHEWAHKPPSDEDIWLAQEDLWVKREMLRIVREANEALAKFKEGPAPSPESVAKKDAPAAKPAEKPAAETKTEPAADKEDKGDQEAKPAPAKPKPAPPPAPPSDPFKKKFHNAVWELSLNLTHDNKGQYSLSGDIKNITKRSQALGIVFKVYLQEQHGEDSSFTPLPIDRLPLAAGESASFKDIPVLSQKAIEGLYGVEQVLTWRTGPVKRIDALSLNQPSSRTANRTLVKPRWIKAPPTDATADANGGAPDGASSGPPGGKFGMMGMMGMMGGGPGGSAGGETSLNGLQLLRYTDTNEQVRHMPVAMVVILDEDGIPDFLAAVANSRLRMQTLQIHWQHTPEKVKPAIEEPSEGDKNAQANEPPKPLFHVQLPGGGGAGQPMGGMPGMPGGMSAMAGKMGGMGGRGGSMESMMQQMMRSMGQMQQQRPSGMAAGKMAAEETGIRGGRSGGMGAMGAAMGPMGRFGGMRSMMSAFGTGLPGAALEGDEDDEQMNLVELTVYGYASLYERFPAKLPAETPTDQANPTANK
jgi:hypothetical protein